MGILQVKILEWVAIPPGDHSKPGIEPRSPALQADSLPSEPLGKSKNAEVDSLSLLHGIFPPQESTWCLFFAGGFFTSWALTEVRPTAISRCL